MVVPHSSWIWDNKFFGWLNQFVSRAPREVARLEASWRNQLRTFVDGAIIRGKHKKNSDVSSKGNSPGNSFHVNKFAVFFLRNRSRFFHTSRFFLLKNQFNTGFQMRYVKESFNLGRTNEKTQGQIQLVKKNHVEGSWFQVYLVSWPNRDNFKQKPTRKIAARTFIQSQYLKELAASWLLRWVEKRLITLRRRLGRVWVGVWMQVAV